MVMTESINRMCEVGIGERYQQVGLSQLPLRVRKKVKKRIPFIRKKPLFCFFYDSSFDVRMKFAGNLALTCLRSDILAKYAYIDDLGSSLRRAWDGDETEIEKFQKIPLLIVDGINEGSANGVTRAALERVLPVRVSNNRHTVVLSSIPFDNDSSGDFTALFGNTLQDIVESVFEVW